MTLLTAHNDGQRIRAHDETRLTRTTAYRIQFGTDGAWVFTQRITILRETQGKPFSRWAVTSIYAPTHSKPGLHRAMLVDWAHAPKTRRETSGMTLAREVEAMVITGANSAEGGS